ncbi:uncharacterized protein A4U43_C02F5170 [Asparagus officinalis]|uniref:mannan endo-1,4-beta-mannosidase n=1 Tax=Asparagus officinalis TaxID=4686 RepID=A0A5P1FG03_ASPOF|nr:uncharacterized protein A4U43_C02F5170 [Asparagus officinalis]
MANLGSTLITLLCLLAILCAHIAPCESTRKGKLHPHRHARAQHVRKGKFVKTKGTRFLLHGSPFLFNGFNAYWMMNVAVEPAERYKVTEVFQQAALAGMNVCRTWAFNDGCDKALQTSPGVYDEQVFQALDFVVSEARKCGVRLILSLVNNYKDYGGRPQYVQWARNAGVSVNGDDDFYTNGVIKGYYKNHIKTVLNRVNTFTNLAYKDDNMIMAWELMNEPRCENDYSGRTVNAWKGFMEIQRRTKSGTTLVMKLELISSPTTSSKKLTLPQSMLTLISVDVERMWSHWNDTKRILKKPLAFTEFGKSKKEPGYSETSRDAFFGMVYSNIYRYARTGGSMGGGLVWQLMARDMESYCDGYEIVLSQEAATSDVISRQSRAMTTLAAKML